MKYRILLILTLLLPVSVIADTSSSKNDASIAVGVDQDIVLDDLSRRNERLLSQLLGSDEDRISYMKEMFKNTGFERKVSESGVLNNPDVKLKVFLAQQDIYLNAVVESILVSKQEDYLALAKEQYESGKGEFVTARKIKIAQIFLDKSKSDVEERLKIVKERLEKSEDKAVEFHRLADEFSDNKSTALNPEFAGTYEKWLIKPVDTSRLPGPLLAAFSLQNVGDISELVDAKRGYHYIKLMSNRPGTPVSFDEVKETLVNNIKKATIANEKRALIKSLSAPDDFTYNDEEFIELIKAAMAKLKKNQAP